MRDAIVAVVSSVTAAYGRPFLRADGGLLSAVAGARDFTAILCFGVPAEEARLAHGDGAPGSAASHRARRNAGHFRIRTLARGSRGDSVRVGYADVEIGTPVAATDRAVIFGARRWHREACPFATGLAARGARCVMTYEAVNVVVSVSPTSSVVGPPTTVTNGSVTVTFVNVTLPSLLTVNVYEIVSPTSA